MTRLRLISLGASAILLAGLLGQSGSVPAASGGGPAVGPAEPGRLLGAGTVPAIPGCLASWATVTTPSPGGKENFLHDVLTVSSSEAWSVGAYDSVGTEPVTVAEHWTGAAWTQASTPSVGAGANYLYGVAGASSSDVWAVGTYLDVPTSRYRTLTLHYTGSSWAVAPSPNVGAGSNILQAVAVVGPTNVWAVGYLEDDVASVMSLVLHYDGSAWSIFPSPNPAASGNYLFGLSAAASNDVWAVGATYVAAAGNLQTLVLHYNGTAWSMVPSPNLVANTANLVLDVDATSSAQAWAVGFANGTDGFQRLVLHWDGVTWSLSPTANGAGKLFAVDAVSSGDVWAVGATGLIVHWDGATWQVVAAPSSVTSGTYFGLSALPGGQLWAVGYNTPLGPVDKTLAARLCETVVSDTGFSVSSAAVPLGSATVWTFPSTNLSTHRILDGQRLGLFDSGLRLPGSSYTFTFTAAGAFAARDSVSAAQMRLPVSPTAIPPQGGVGTTFTVTWATAPVAGFVFDVQIKRPGATWADWKTGVTTLSSTFLPDVGTGQYSFRARIRSTSSGRASGYSPAATITVT